MRIELEPFVVENSERHPQPLFSLFSLSHALCMWIMFWVHVLSKILARKENSKTANEK